MLAVASKAGLSLRKKIVESKEDLMELSPLSQGMVLSLMKDGHIGGSSAAMMKALASMIPTASSLAGRNFLESAHIDSWVQYGISAIEIAVEASSSVDVKDDLAQALSILGQHLSSSSSSSSNKDYFMVGDSITIADISLCCSLYQATTQKLWNCSSSSSSCMDGDYDDENLVVVREWYTTVTNQVFFLTALTALSSLSDGIIAEISNSSSNNNN